MCAACVEYEKGRMTRQELDRAIRETIMDADEDELIHAIEVLQDLGDE